MKQGDSTDNPKSSGKATVWQLMSLIFRKSNNLLTLGLVLSILAVIIAQLISILSSTSPWIVGAFSALISISGRILIWKSEPLRADAEELLRATEYNIGLGFPIDESRLADLRVKYDRLFKPGWTQEIRKKGSFDTKERIGSLRFIEMIRESSWWSYQLASKLKRKILWMVILVIIFLILFRPFSAFISCEDSLSTHAFTSIICIIISVEFFYLFYKYHLFEKAARDSYGRLTGLRNDNRIDEKKSLMLAMKYQLERSNCPPLPSWLWRCYQKTLNDVWREELSGNGQRPIQL